jgi:hypothetical protein
MNIAFSKKYKYGIIFPPKSGCCWIRKIFFDLHKDELDLKPNQNFHSLKHDFPVPKNHIDSHPFLMLGRNPYTRAVSMYTNKIISPTRTAIISGMSRNIKYTFREFLHLVQMHRIISPSKLNDHFRLQINDRSLVPKENITIAKLENCYDDVSNFYKLLGNETLYSSILNLIESSKSKRVPNKTWRVNFQQFVGDFNFALDSKRFPDYEYFYNKDIKDLVFSIYKQDFNFLDYPRHSIKCCV